MPKTNLEQAQLEHRLLGMFFDHADRRGLSLPEDSQRLRELLGREVSPADWPPAPLLSIMGLAQHSRLPTRLLDWTWDPWIAAFFAAEDGLRELARRKQGEAADPMQDEICVYSLSADVFDSGFLEASRIEFPGGRLELVTAPYSGNPNLRAQEGAFTLWRPTLQDPCGSQDSRSLDILLGGALEVAKQIIPLPIQTRFSLPLKEAPLALHYLINLGYGPSRIFPGYGGVIDELKLRQDLGSKPW